MTPDNLHVAQTSTMWGITTDRLHPTKESAEKELAEFKDSYNRLLVEERLLIFNALHEIYKNTYDPKELKLIDKIQGIVLKRV